MNFKDLLKLLEKGESIANPLSGIIGNASGILNMLGVGRKKQIRQQKEMAENAAKINYKYGERRPTSTCIKSKRKSNLHTK
jgi:hypothetical protein